MDRRFRVWKTSNEWSIASTAEGRNNIYLSFLTYDFAVFLQGISELPPNFPVTDRLIGNLLGRGSLLRDELRSGNIYLQDFSMMQDVPTVELDGTRLHAPSPLVLFYLREDGDLVPLAIQLGQDPGPDFPVWTPNDTPDDWMWAKMWVKNAEGMASQLFFHLTLHFTSEVFVVAMLRCLSPAHPVFKLMKVSRRG